MACNYIILEISVWIGSQDYFPKNNEFSRWIFSYSYHLFSQVDFNFWFSSEQDHIVLFFLYNNFNLMKNLNEILWTFYTVLTLLITCDLPCRTFVSQVVTGYLPSVVLLLFLYTVPPLMMIFSTVEGSISRSARKKSTCIKVLYFTIWNVFFVNLLSGSVIIQLNVISSPKGIPTQLAKAVPRQVIIGSYFL